MRIFRLNCQTFRRIIACVYFLGSSFAFAKAVPDNGRKPASFVPDDDMIIVPMVIEKGAYDRFNERHEKDFYWAKQRLRGWIQAEEYAEAYGLENRAIILPTPDQKQRFFERRFIRFLNTDVQRSANEGIQNTIQELTEDDEIDAIQAIEMHEKVLVKAERKQGKKTFKKSKSVKVGKDRIKFDFQPRIEMGMARVTMKARGFRARAWVAVNGNHELFVEKKFKSTKTRAYMNYRFENERGFAAIDQKLSRHWSLRLTHNKNFRAPESDPNEGVNNVVQLRFGMKF